MGKNRNLNKGFGEFIAVVCVVFVAYAILHSLHPSVPPKQKPQKRPVERGVKRPSSGRQPQTQAKAPVARRAVVPVLPQVVPFEKPAPMPAAPEQAVLRKPRIAIVIDDWGYTTRNLPLARQIASRFPVTAAVMPRLPYSTKVAEELHSLGVEIILHLPMEPNELKNLEKNTIMTSWKPRKIQTVLDQDLSSVRYAKGINNHMGSKATADQETMNTVISYLDDKGLYFLDSFVSAESIGRELAKEHHVPSARRDVFLDNSDDPSAIRNQLEKLKEKARDEGQAVGIGHDRPATLKVLLEEVPKIQSEGIDFVFVSQLLEQ